MDAAIIELDALPYSNWPTPDGHQAFFCALLYVWKKVNSGSAMWFVGRIIVGRFCCKFCSTGIHHPVDRVQAKLMTTSHDRAFILTRSQGFEPFCGKTGECISNVSITEPMAFPTTDFVQSKFGGRYPSLNNLPLHSGQAFKSVQEPSSDSSDFMDPLNGPLPAERF